MAPLFFSPIQSWPEAGAHSAVAPPLFLLFPLLSPWKSLNLLSLYVAHPFKKKKKSPPLFFSHYWFHFLRSKPRGRWHPPAPLRAPSFPPTPPSFNPSFFSFVRHCIRIYKSRLTPLQKTSSKSLQAATFSWSVKSFKTHTHKQWGQTKESQRKGYLNGFGRVFWSGGGRDRKGLPDQKEFWCLLLRAYCPDA